MEIVNIDLLATMLLEPQQPQITSASLTVGKRHLYMVGAWSILFRN